MAEEVRRLAERSKSSAADIERIVEGVHTETNATVMAMEKGAKQMQHGLVLLDQVADAADQVRLTTQQQRSATAQVVETMEQLTDASRQVAMTAQQIASAAGNLADRWPATWTRAPSWSADGTPAEPVLRPDPAGGRRPLRRADGERPRGRRRPALHRRARRAVVGARRVNLRGEVVPLLDTATMLGLGAMAAPSYAAVVDLAVRTGRLRRRRGAGRRRLDDPLGQLRAAGSLGRHRVDGQLVVLLDPEVLWPWRAATPSPSGTGEQ